MECLFPVQRFGKRVDDIQEFDEGTWPAVGEKKRDRIRVGRSAVDKVDRRAVALEFEVRELNRAKRGLYGVIRILRAYTNQVPAECHLIDLLFPEPPLVFVPPVLNKFL